MDIKTASLKISHSVNILTAAACCLLILFGIANSKAATPSFPLLEGYGAFPKNYGQIAVQYTYSNYNRVQVGEKAFMDQRVDHRENQTSFSRCEICEGEKTRDRLPATTIPNWAAQKTQSRSVEKRRHRSKTSGEEDS